jgi:hypothetical protein
MKDSRVARTQRAKQRAGSVTGRRPRSSGGASRRRAGESNGNPALIAGVVFGGLALVLVIAWAAMASGSKAPSGKSGSQTSTKTDDTTTNQSTATAPQPLPASAPRAGKTPDRPAPPLTAELFAELDAHYEVAKNHWNDALRAKNVGDHGTFADEAHAGWDAIEKLENAMSDQTYWLEEADLSGWELPGSYVTLQEKLATFDKLRQRIKKNMPMRER